MAQMSFLGLLLGISDSLSPDDLERIKYLVQGRVGKRELEQIRSGLQLFRVLSERLVFSEENPDELVELLRQIKRPDLAERLDTFQRGAGAEAAGRRPDEAETAKLDLTEEFIAETLGRYWRKLGRKLGLSEVKLDSVGRRWPTDLEETVRELMKEWRKSRGPAARAEEVVLALRACELNLTADKLRERLEQSGTR